MCQLEIKQQTQQKVSEVYSFLKHSLRRNFEKVQTHFFRIEFWGAKWPKLVPPAWPKILLRWNWFWCIKTDFWQKFVKSFFQSFLHCHFFRKRDSQGLIHYLRESKKLNKYSICPQKLWFLHHKTEYHEFCRQVYHKKTLTPFKEVLQ